jgi:hypothetical protein
MLLSGCAGGSFETSPPLDGFVKKYSQPFLNRAADELEELPPDSAVALMIADYGVLRAQLKASR